MDNNSLRSMTKKLYEVIPGKMDASFPDIVADLDGVGVFKTQRFRHSDWTREDSRVSVIPDYASVEVLVATHRNMNKINFQLVSGIEEYWRIGD